MSLTLMGAMAARLPIVATEVGGNPTLIHSGVNGILVPPGDVKRLSQAMIRVLGDQDLASGLGAAARSRFERDFDLEGIGKFLLQGLRGVSRP